MSRNIVSKIDKYDVVLLLDSHIQIQITMSQASFFFFNLVPFSPPGLSEDRDTGKQSKKGFQSSPSPTQSSPFPPSQAVPDREKISLRCGNLHMITFPLIEGVRE